MLHAMLDRLDLFFRKKRIFVPPACKGKIVVGFHFQFFARVIVQAFRISGFGIPIISNEEIGVCQVEEKLFFVLNGHAVNLFLCEECSSQKNSLR